MRLTFWSKANILWKVGWSSISDVRGCSTSHHTPRAAAKTTSTMTLAVMQFPSLTLLELVFPSGLNLDLYVLPLLLRCQAIGRIAMILNFLMGGMVKWYYFLKSVTSWFLWSFHSGGSKKKHGIWKTNLGTGYKSNTKIFKCFLNFSLVDIHTQLEQTGACKHPEPALSRKTCTTALANPAELRISWRSGSKFNSKGSAMRPASMV